jgi:hypothetical protein
VPPIAVRVIFIHGPAAAGKHTIGTRLAERSGLPLFHNHLAVDAARALFEFGTPPFKALRATIWRAAFAEAATARRSFIFTFHPEASVDRALVDELVATIEAVGGEVLFVALACSEQSVLARLGNPSRAAFGKLTDASLYMALEREGAFAFPALPPAWLVLDTDRLDPDAAATTIIAALARRADA